MNKKRIGTFIGGFVVGTIIAVFLSLSHYYFYNDIETYKVGAFESVYHKSSPTYGIMLKDYTKFIKLLEDEEYDAAKRLCYDNINVALIDAKERLNALECGWQKERLNKVIQDTEKLVKNLKNET